MQKNVSGQKWVVFAFDVTDNLSKASDAANITANLRLDGGAADAIDDTNPTELENGYYVFDVTQAETNANMILISPESSTSNIQVIGVPGVAYTTPPNFSIMGIESDGDITKVNTLDSPNTYKADVSALALASVCTEARLAELAAANIPTDIANVKAETALIVEDTNELQTDWTDGGRLDLLQDRILTATEIKQSTVNDLSATTTKFITDLTQTQNDFWNRGSVVFTSGNNAGQMRRIKDYVGATKEITVQTPLDAAPADGDTFIIPVARAFLTVDIEDIVDQVCDETLTGVTHNVADSLGRRIREIHDSVFVEEETAQGGTIDTITLATSANANDNFYNNSQLSIIEGTGVGQTRTFKTYNGTTKVATACEDWVVTPDNTSKYVITGHACVSVFNIQSGVLNDISVADVLGGIVEGTITLAQAQSLIMAVLAGKSSGGGTSTLILRDVGDTKNRVVATVDADGNRTEMVIDET